MGWSLRIIYLYTLLAESNYLKYLTFHSKLQGSREVFSYWVRETQASVGLHNSQHVLCAAFPDYPVSVSPGSMSILPRIPLPPSPEC